MKGRSKKGTNYICGYLEKTPILINVLPFFHFWRSNVWKWVMLIKKNKSLVAASLYPMVLLSLKALFDFSLKMPFRYLFFKGSIFFATSVILENLYLLSYCQMFNFLITSHYQVLSEQRSCFIFLYPLYLAKFLVFGESSQICA